MASGWVWTFCFVVCVQGIRALNNFTVGGYKGWHVPSGLDSYNQWAGKIRFQIGDSLLFKYDQNVDSVLLVSSENYKTCNTMSPNKSFEDGNTTFKLYSHGPFYFISGNSSNCKKGEKLTVVVLAPCHNGQSTNCGNSSSPSPSPSPSPKTSPIPSTITSPSPSPKTSPSPSTSHGPTPAPISHPSLSPHSSTSSSPYSSPPAESPEMITPSSSSNYTSPAPPPVQSDSSSSATSLVNLVIPLMLVTLLKPSL